MTSPLRVPRDSWYSPKIQVRTSSIHGDGTFAVAHIAADEVVEIWGERTNGTPTVIYTADPETVRHARSSGKIVMQWDENLFSIEDQAADEGYFMNHSCDSTLGFQDAFTLVARREIKPGQEVTLDYGLFESDNSYVTSWQCHCGADVCRGRVTGADWQRSDMQARYAGYFSPLLRKRINGFRD